MSVIERETDLFRTLQAWLSREVDPDTGEELVPWACHGEKTIITADRRRISVDMIAQQQAGDGRVAAYQGKLRLNWYVIDQAEQVRPYVHLCSVVVGHPGRYPRQAHKVLVQAVVRKQLGLIYITKDGQVEVAVKSPRFAHPDMGPVAEALSRGHTLVQQAGTPSPLGITAEREADRWAPLRAVLADAGMALTEKEIFAACPHYTHRDRVDFRRMAPRGQLRGVACHTHAVPYTYYLQEEM